MASINKQSKATQERHRKVLADMLRKPENKECMDCRARNPSWASINIGCFLCIRCSGLHRQIGVHISQVRSTTMDIWQPEQIAFIQTMGNANVKAIWEAKLPKDYGKPSEDEDSELVMQWIRTKYEKKKYFSASGRVAEKPAAEAPKNMTVTNTAGKKKPRKERNTATTAGSAEAPQQVAQQAPVQNKMPGWDPNGASYLDGAGFGDATEGTANSWEDTGDSNGFGGATFSDNAGGGFGLDGGNGGQVNSSFNDFVSFSPSMSPRPEVGGSAFDFVNVGNNQQGAGGAGAAGWGTLDQTSQNNNTSGGGIKTNPNIDHNQPSLLGGRLAPGQSAGGQHHNGSLSPSSMMVEGMTHSRGPSNGGVVFDPFDQSPPTPTVTESSAINNNAMSTPESSSSPTYMASPTSGEINPSGGSTMMMQMLMQQQQALVQMQMQQQQVIQAGGTVSPEFAAMLHAAQEQFNAMMATFIAQQQGGAAMAPAEPQSPIAGAETGTNNGFAPQSDGPDGFAFHTEQQTASAGGGFADDNGGNGFGFN